MSRIFGILPSLIAEIMDGVKCWLTVVKIDGGEVDLSMKNF